jgi:glutamine amidotransferase
VSAVTVLDLDYGNTESIRLAFARLGAEVQLARDPAAAERAERLVLPGVGAAPYAMARLNALDLVEPLRRRTRPSLGICLGMQLLFEHSEEGAAATLGIVPGEVRALAAGPGAPVPHMGWSSLYDPAPGLGLQAGEHVYFAHGFVCDDGPFVAAHARYGERPIPAALRHGPWWGAQFHPERSSAAGNRFLQAFLAA